MKMLIQGHEMAFELSGDPSTPVVVFGNSLMANMAMWDDVLPLFQGRWRILRYDMRGHGESAAPDAAFGIAELASDVVHLLDALEIEQVHFVGLSLGGMVGIQLAASHGERLLSLTAADTGITLASAARAAWGQRIADVRANGIGSIADGTLARWFTPAFLVNAPAAVARVRAMLLQTSVEGYARCGEAIQAVDLVAAATGIRVPTLVVNGREDGAWPPETALALLQAIAGARLAWVHDAAHIPCIEQPQAWAATVSDFLLEVQRLTPGAVAGARNRAPIADASS